MEASCFRTKLLAFTVASLLTLSSSIGFYRAEAAPEENIEHAPSQFGHKLIEEWVAVWDSLGNDTGYDVAVDSHGDPIIVGESGGDIFLAKYNSTGHELWNITWGDNGNQSAAAITVDYDDGIIITGSTSRNSNGEYDAVLLKYDQSGNLLWSSTWGGSNDDFGRGVDIGPGGNVFVCGVTNSFGSGERDLFVAAFSSDGELQWDEVWGDEHDQAAYDLVTDWNGSVYVAGVTFTEGNPDVLLVSVDLSGILRWTATWGSSGEDVGYAIDLCPDGSVLVVGHTEDFEKHDSIAEDTVVILEYNSAGTFFGYRAMDLWNEDAKHYRAYDVICDDLNRIHIVGETDLGAMIISTSRITTGGSAMYSMFGDVFYGLTLNEEYVLYCVGAESSYMSTNFGKLSAFSDWFDYEEPEHEVEQKWRYSGDGVVYPMGVADFTGNGIKEMICRFYTIEGDWLEIIDDGKLLWKFQLPPNSTRVFGSAANLDSDSESELLAGFSNNESGVQTLVALDSDGQVMWDWTGVLTSTIAHPVDMDSDGVDEIAMVIAGGIELWDASSLRIWNLEAEINATQLIQSVGDYDRNGNPDLVVSVYDESPSGGASYCIVFDFGGNRLVEFPLLSAQSEEEPAHVGRPIQVELANFYNTEKMDFFYMTAVNDTHVSQFIVDSSGIDIGWRSPWSPAMNMSWLHESKPIVMDIDEDGTSEVVHWNEQDASYAMDAAGRIKWKSHFLGGILVETTNSRIPILADFDGDGRKDILTDDGWLHAYDPRTGQRMFAVHIPYGDLVLALDIDNDGRYEVIGSNVYRVEVWEYAGIWSPYNNDYPSVAQSLTIAAIIMTSAIVVISLVWWRFREVRFPRGRLSDLR